MAAWNTAAETSQMVTLPCGAEPYQTVGKTQILLLVIPTPVRLCQLQQGEGSCFLLNTELGAFSLQCGHY